jgi:hypothetical protein
MYHVTVYKTCIHFTGAHICWQTFQHQLLGITVSSPWQDTNTQKCVLKHPHVYIAACIITCINVIMVPIDSHLAVKMYKHGKPQFIIWKFMYLFHLWRSQHMEVYSVAQLLVGSRHNLMGVGESRPTLLDSI